MALSERKLEANRANALKSTGPRTATGKRASSLNALRHGLTAQVVVLPSEDLAAYRTFTANFVHDLAPEGILETQLAQTLADTQWRMNRFRALEAALFSLGHERNAAKLDLGHGEEAQSIQTALAAAQSLTQNLEALKTLSLYEQRLSRAFALTLKQLRESQALRRQTQPDHPTPPLRLVPSPHREPAPAAQFGFVSQTTNAPLHILRPRHNKTSPVRSAHSSFPHRRSGNNP